MERDTQLYHVVLDLVSAVNALHLGLRHITERLGQTDKDTQMLLDEAEGSIAAAIRNVRAAVDSMNSPV